MDDELDERAGDDIGAFNCDANRYCPIKSAQIVLRPFHHRFSAVHVHSVVDRHA